MVVRVELGQERLDPLLRRLQFRVETRPEAVAQLGLQLPKLRLDGAHPRPERPDLDLRCVALRLRRGDLLYDLALLLVERDGVLAHHVVLHLGVDLPEGAVLLLDLALEELPGGRDTGPTRLPRQVNEGLGVHVGDQGRLSGVRATDRHLHRVGLPGRLGRGDVVLLEREGHFLLSAGPVLVVVPKHAQRAVGAGDPLHLHQPPRGRLGERVRLREDEQLVAQVRRVPPSAAHLLSPEDVGERRVLFVDQQQGVRRVDRRLDDAVEQHRDRNQRDGGRNDPATPQQDVEEAPEVDLVVLEPFVRLHDSRSRQGVGAGHSRGSVRVSSHGRGIGPGGQGPLGACGACRNRRCEDRPVESRTRERAPVPSRIHMHRTPSPCESPSSQMSTRTCPHSPPPSPISSAGGWMQWCALATWSGTDRTPARAST